MFSESKGHRLLLQLNRILFNFFFMVVVIAVGFLAFLLFPLARISFKISVDVFVQSIKSVLPFQCFGRRLAGNQMEVQLVLASYGIQ